MTKEDIIKEEDVDKITPKNKPSIKPKDKLSKKKKVFINVDGKDMEVRFPISAILKLQNETGVKISDLQDEEKAQDLSVIIALIWAGVVTESPEVTIEYLADNIEMHELNEISQKVVSVISAPGK